MNELLRTAKLITRIEILVHQFQAWRAKRRADKFIKQNRDTARRLARIGLL